MKLIRSINEAMSLPKIESSPEKKNDNDISMSKSTKSKNK
jgi:hypothetical protein